ncbi:Nucleotide-diphospho-sugar transferases superfamily protein [Prunus dulcis]|uniref:Nucleotide-diphospho-sugar transferases superfamily protein n=1 Tax=Prunus dulcis TaxID=3755 RepID=A0A5H2YCI0_PRUDU|nr:Nucleotide-diphospho-sugar transferases superfamily protein [Prunus dulcis]
MSAIIGIRDAGPTGAVASAIAAADMNGGIYSPAKEKAAARGVYTGRSQLIRRLRSLVCAAKLKLVVCVVIFSVVVLVTSSRLSSVMGWVPPHPNPTTSSRGGGYTVLMNTWKRSSALKQSIGHYASCGGVEAIHVVWTDSEPPSESMKYHLEKMAFSKSQAAKKPNFKFSMSQDDDLNNRFKPIQDLRSDAIFSVDDDVKVPCSTLDFAFTVWQSAPNTMVGFVPRMHWLDKEKSGVEKYTYGGWWSVWWMGTYSLLLPKAAFFHRNYLNLYTNNMPSSIRDYVTRERNCEDIAMSLLVANATGAPPIWVKGKTYEIGSSGMSSMKRHSNRRNKCLNDFISLFGRMPLVSTDVKAVDTRLEWFW